MHYTPDQIAVPAFVVLAGAVALHALMTKIFDISRWDGFAAETTGGQNMTFFSQSMYILVCIVMGMGIMASMLAAATNPALQNFFGMEPLWLACGATCLAILGVATSIAEKRAEYQHPAVLHKA